jgi:nucleoside-diphosphate-sugar epimerase
MIHAAAQAKPYACFVRPDTRIPFMTMPDAINSIFALTDASATDLTQCVYNVSAFNPTADKIEELVRVAYPKAEITYEPDRRRQAIVDSWPRAVDDKAARGDWGLAPAYDLESAFADYLIPTIARRYA